MKSIIKYLLALWPKRKPKKSYIVIVGNGVSEVRDLTLREVVEREQKKERKTTIYFGT